MAISLIFLVRLMQNPIASPLIAVVVFFFFFSVSALEIECLSLDRLPANERDGAAPTAEKSTRTLLKTMPGAAEMRCIEGADVEVSDRV